MSSPTGMESQTRGLRDKDLRPDDGSFILRFNKPAAAATAAVAASRSLTHLQIHAISYIHT